MKYTAENMEQLARDVVDGWDMDTLITMAVETLAMEYDLDEDSFNRDVEYMA